MICIWAILCLHFREWEIPQNYSFLRKTEKQNKKNRVCHSTSINNYLQNTQKNTYFFEWRGNARRALASFL